MYYINDYGLVQIDKREKARQLGRRLDPGVPNHQDRFGESFHDGVFAVADGVASRAHSGEAAQAVCDVFIEELSGSERVLRSRDFFAKVGGGLLARMHEAALRTGGATTFTGIAVTPDGNVNYLHVGDTVLLRVRQSGVETLTTEQIYGDFRRHVLYNYLGNSGYIDPTTGQNWDTQRQPKLTPRPGMKARPLMMEAEWGARPLQDGDRLILASDGVMEDREHQLISYPELVRRTSLSLGALASAQVLTKEPTKVDDLITSVIDFRKSK